MLRQSARRRKKQQTPLGRGSLVSVTGGEGGFAGYHTSKASVLGDMVMTARRSVDVIHF